MSDDNSLGAAGTVKAEEELSSRNKFLNILFGLIAKHREKGKVYFPGYNLTEKVESPAIPDFSITNADDDQSVLVDAVVDHRSVSSITIHPKKSRRSDMSNFIHDFTVSTLTDSTDEPLRKGPWGLILDGSDDHTPDLIHTSGKTSLVVEFTTRQSSHVKVLIDAFNAKKATYLNSLETRAIKWDTESEGENITKLGYFIVVISPQSVLSNITGLDQELVDELCFRYMCARSLVPQFRQLNIQIVFEDEELTRRQKDTINILMGIEHKFGPLGSDDPWNPFTREFYENAISPVTDDDLSKVNSYIEKALCKSFSDHDSDYGIETIISQKSEKLGISKSQVRREMSVSPEDISNYTKDVCSQLQEKFIEESRAPFDGETRRMDRKAVSQIPYLVPIKKDFDVNLSDPSSGEAHPFWKRVTELTDLIEDPHVRIWNQVAWNVINDKVGRQDSQVKMGDEEIEEVFSSNLKEKLRGLGLNLQLDPTYIKEKGLLDKRRLDTLESRLTRKRKTSEELSEDPLEREKIKREAAGQTAQEQLDELERVLEVKKLEFAQSGLPLSASQLAELNSLMAQIENKSKTLPQLKRDYHRTVVDILTFEEKIELAKLGLGGKSQKDESDVRNYREEKRKAFSWDTDTSDIQRFLEEGPVETSRIYEDTSKSSSDLSYGLLDFVANIHGKPTVEALKLAKSFSQSSLGRFTEFVSDLATELCISLKQHCKPSEFIVKKLAYYDVFLVISPTNSDSHIFFSIATTYSSLHNDERHSGVFKKAIEINDDLFIYPFVSVNKSKLVNLVSLESKVLATFFYFCEFYAVAPQTCDHLYFQSSYLAEHNELEKKSLLVHQQTLFATLMMIHDKAAAEEVMTLSRYIFMEGFVCQPEFPRPYKIIEKFSTNQKSRLELFIQKRLFESMLRIVDSPFKGLFYNPGQSQLDNLDNIGDISSHTTRDLKEKKYINLFDPILHMPLESPLQLISTWYLGYYKNKEESPEKNSIHQLFDKIIGFEDKFEQRYDFVGMKDPPAEDTRKHEFSPSLVKSLSDYAAKTIKSQYGPNGLDELHREILDALYYQDLEKMSTLKATSNFSPDWYEFKEGERYTRSKVIEKVVPEINEVNNATSLVHILKQNLVKLEDNECMHIDIFRKQQHGGMREIYVLDFPSRVVQLSIETIARVICSKFPGETMTHPKNKFKLPSNHANKAKKTFQGTSYVTFCTNDDAAKWNQGHFVTKFAIMLYRLTDPLLHPLITRGLRLWMKKKIMLPTELINIFMAVGDEQLSNPTFNLMKECFRGNAEVFWMKRGNRYIETRTGMMQGILHYTSSLFHVIYQNWLEHSIADWIQKTFAGMRDYRSIVTTMESSDDSAVLITIPVDQVSELRSAMNFISVMFRFKANLGEYLGIYDSVKSTKMTLDLLEFNSEFFFGGNLFRPTIRWVAACCNISEQESFVGRQEEMSNLCSSILEGGACLLTTFLCQVAQGLLHYRLLGSSVSPIFRYFSRSLIECPDPSSGMFLLDNVFLAGLSGFKYNLWLVTISTSLSKKVKFLISSMTTVNAQKTNFLEGRGPETWESDRRNRIKFLCSLIDRDLPLKGSGYFITVPLSDDDEKGGLIVKRNEILDRHIRNIEIDDVIKLKEEEEKTRAKERLREVRRGLATSTGSQFKDDINNTGSGIPQELEAEEEVDLGINLFKRGYSLDTSEAGNLVNATMVSFGNRQKYYKLLENLDLPSDWKEKNEENPEIYFRRGNTPDEVLRKIAIKATSPGVTQSLSKGNSVARIISSSVYLLTENIVSLSSIWVDGVYERFTKFRMIELILRDLSNLKPGGGFDKDLSEAELASLFPFQEDYKELLDIASTRNSIIGAPCSRPRTKKRTDVVITESLFSEEYDLEKICKWKWFPHLDKLPMANRVKQEIWEEYRATFQWLKETIRDTLADSLFQSYQQMHNYLARHSRKHRVIHLTSAPISAHSGKSGINSVINQDFFPGMTMSRSKSDDLEVSRDANSLTKMRNILHVLYMMQQTELRNSHQIMWDLLTRDLGLSVSTRSGKRSKAFFLVQSVLRKIQEMEELDPESPDYLREFKKLKSNILREVIRVNYGTFGVFTERQKYDRELKTYTGKGSWSGMMGSTNVNLTFESMQASSHTGATSSPLNYLTRLVVNKLDDLQDVLLQVQQLCKESKILSANFPQHFIHKSWRATPTLPSGIKPIANILSFKRLAMPDNRKTAVLVLDPEYKFDWTTDSIIGFDLDVKPEAIRVITRHKREWTLERNNPSYIEKIRRELEFLLSEQSKLKLLDSKYSDKSWRKRGNELKKVNQQIEQKRKLMESEVSCTIISVPLGPKSIVPDICDTGYLPIEAKRGTYKHALLYWSECTLDLSEVIKKLETTIVDDDSRNMSISFIRQRFQDTCSKNGLLAGDFTKKFDAVIERNLEEGTKAQEYMKSGSYSDYLLRVSGKLSKERTEELRMELGVEGALSTILSEDLSSLVEGEVNKELELEGLTKPDSEPGDNWADETEVERYQQRRQALLEEKRIEVIEQRKQELFEVAIGDQMFNLGKEELYMVLDTAHNTLFGEAIEHEIQPELLFEWHPLARDFVMKMMASLKYQNARYLIRDKVYDQSVPKEWVEKVSILMGLDIETFKESEAEEQPEYFAPLDSDDDIF